MPLLDQLQTQIVAAMKAKDEHRLSTLRMVKAALQKHQIDAMKPLDEATELQVLTTLLKQRRDAAEMFRKGARINLAEKEESEMKMVESLMPAGASAEAMAAAVAEAIAETGATSSKQMGQVVSAAKAKLAGQRIDGKALSDMVREKLQ